MHTRILTLVILVAVAGPGCKDLLFLRPFIDEAESVPVRELTGAWEAAHEEWVFSENWAGTGKYTVRMSGNHWGPVGSQRRDTLYLVAVAGRLGGRTFFDVTIDSDRMSKRSGVDELALSPYLVATHLAVRFDLSGDSLTLWSLSREARDRLTGLAPERTALDLGEQGMLVTASTSEVRTMLAGFAADESMWSDPHALVRVRP
jgi:hypothetical protein